MWVIFNILVNTDLIYGLKKQRLDDSVFITFNVREINKVLFEIKEVLFLFGRGRYQVILFIIHKVVHEFSP
jgi:hypothetical protein